MSRYALFAWVIVLLLSPADAIAQEPSKRKRPESSKAADFDATKLSKVAVIVTGGKSSDSQTEQQRLVEDVFLEALLARGHNIVARSDVDSVLKEKRFQESDLAEQLAATVGKVLNVPAVLVIRVTENSIDSPRPSTFVAKVSIGARLISVETGSILWTAKHSESGNIPSKAASGGALQKVASELAECFPERRSGIESISLNTIDPSAFPKLAVVVVGERSVVKRSPVSEKGGRAARPESQSDHERQVEDAFVAVLLKKGYNLVSRSDLQTVAKEQQFQHSGITEDNAVAVGKLLNVPAVLLVMTTDFSSETRTEPTSRQKVTLVRASIGARLVNVASGEIWWTHGESLQREVGSKGATTDVLDKVAKDVAEFFPPSPDSKAKLLAQGDKLEKMGQLAAASNYYRCVIKTYPDTTEASKAGGRLKILNSKKAPTGN